jgi:rhomboid protease GluP
MRNGERGTCFERAERVAAILILASVLMVLYLRSLNPEERVEFLRSSRAKMEAAVRSARDEITRVPPECQTFVEELRARTTFAAVTPAVVSLNVAIFIGMCFGAGALTDPATLIGWGGSVGPRTTNGEWWRLVTSLFVHAGVLRLLANVIGFVSVGFMLERLVGPVAFAVTYVAAGVMAGVVELSAHQIDVNTGASGAIFGVYGLLVASTMWGFYRPSSATIPLAALKGLAPGAFVFLSVDVLTHGLHSGGRFAGFAAGFAAGMILVVGAMSGKPAMQRVWATLGATAGIIILLVAPLRGLDDARADVAAVIAVEGRTAHQYDAEIERANDGRSSMRERIVLIDQIRPQLQALRARLESFDKVAREQQPLVASAIEFLKTRDESWRLRKVALR